LPTPRIAEARRLATDLERRAQQLRLSLESADVSPGGATLTSLAVIGLVKKHLRDVEEALTLAAADDASVPLETYADTLGMTVSQLRRNIDSLRSKEDGVEPGLLLGFAGSDEVRLRPGSNLQVCNHDGAISAEDIDALLNRFREQSSSHQFMTSPACKEVQFVVSEVLDTAGDRFAGAPGVFVITGACEDDVAQVLARRDRDRQWSAVTVVWIDTRPSDEGTDVTIEAGFGTVIRAVPHEPGGQYLVSGPEGAGVRLALSK